MSHNRQWHEHLRSYTEIVAIELERPTDLSAILEKVCGDLRPCPFDFTGSGGIIVPKQAIALLPLASVPHTLVEIRHLIAVSQAVCREIRRRFNARKEPHYYVSRHVAQPPSPQLAQLLQKSKRPVPTQPYEMTIVHRMYARLTTIEEIEQQLARVPA